MQRLAHMVEKARAGINWLTHQAWFQKYATTAVMLVVIYYLATTAVAWITAPKINMTMSPVAGAVAVLAKPAKRGPITEEVTYSAFCIPYLMETVYPRVDGWIQRYFVDVGDRVKKGQLLVQLDKTELRGKLAEAEANLEYLRREYQRQEKLYKVGGISQSERDLAKSRYEMASGQVEYIKTQIGYTDIYSDIDGVVAERLALINKGELVQANTPLLRIADLSRIRVQCPVAERDLPFIKVGTPVVVHFPVLPPPQDQVDAKVTAVFPRLDPVTRQALIEVMIPNPHSLIKPEMYAVTHLILAARSDAIVIPRQAVLKDDQGDPMVFVTDDAVTATAHKVKLGIADGDRIQVLSGVKPGEMVIYAGNRGLVDGEQVQIEQSF